MEDLTDADDRAVEGNATTGRNAHQIATCRGSWALTELCLVFDQDLGQSSTSCNIRGPGPEIAGLTGNRISRDPRLRWLASQR